MAQIGTAKGSTVYPVVKFDYFFECEALSNFYYWAVETLKFA